MSRALVTFGTGPAADLLAVAEPTFREYADRHGYRLLIADEIPGDRPASWYKVPVMLQALREHDEVLWLDADVVILNDLLDLADQVPHGAWQALVAHHTPDGEVPNHGVWHARRELVPVLERIWRMTEYTHHPWWEQAAGCQLLGYDPWKRPMTRERETDLYHHTTFLGNEWNSHRDDESDRPRFWHASVRGPDRAALMREMLAEHAAA